MIRIGASPHVSLAVFDTVDIARLIDVARSFAENTVPFRIRFSSLGIFRERKTSFSLRPL
jgi:hypothetical protein